MADSQSNSRSNTPGASLPVKRTLEEVHAPSISSPLNPNPDRARPRAPQREQREKRETIKKREASSNTRGNTPNPRTKKERPEVDSPMRYSIPEPKPSDYDPPRDGLFQSREPFPLLTPDGHTELKKPVDLAWNKKGYKYTHCVADPQFRHKQFYRQSDSKPYGPRMSHEDTDRWFHFDDSATIVTQEKGWRMGRGNVVAREGRMYYEVRVLRGIPVDGPKDPIDSKTGDTKPGPHIRVGWARREAPLDGPVGFDGYSYGITDSRFEAQHRSRASKIFKPLPKSAKSKHMKPRPPHGKPGPVEYVSDECIQEGDVIGLEIQLPSLALHRKVVEGIYNPAVDLGDGFDAKDAYDPTEKPLDIIRDRIPVSYKGNFFFEQLDYQVTKAVDAYHDRGPVPKIHPSPNHEDVSVRSLPSSHIKVYKNGKEIGIAFESLLAFLPPASVPSAEAVKAGARAGFDDGMVGYFPAVAAFNGGVAQVNFGPNFWYPTEEMLKERERDTQMQGTDTVEKDIPQERRLKAIGERYKEQIAEDVVWDIIDEVDFFVQDGGWDYKGETPQDVAGKSTPKARGFANPDENVGVEVGRRY
ncbi:transcription factor, contains a PHD finger motif [Kalmusia sp. IMI 367209]|nr:transcription factor, contains a PHD finger motif [Kalmusia sp. IMI 367209]